MSTRSVTYSVSPTNVDLTGITKMDSGIKGVGKTALGVSKDVVKGLGDISKKAVLVGIALSGVALKVFGDFEQSMAEVRATMGNLTDEQFKVLTEEAKRLGATTSFSAKQAADALNFLALAGFNVEKSVAALPHILSLAAAGSMDLALASDLVTDSMSALGLESKDLEGFVNQLVKTSQRSNTNVQQLGEGILSVGGLAKDVGLEVSELNTFLGILANNGIKGAEGGVKLRNALLSLSVPTDNAAKIIKDLGVNVVNATTGEFENMGKVFMEFSQALDGMGGAEKTKILSEIFNKQDLKAINALLKDVTTNFDILNKEIIDSVGAAASAANIKLDTLQGSFKLLQSAGSSLAITFGEAISPAIRDLAGFTTEMLPKVEELLKVISIGLRMSAYIGDQVLLAFGIKKFSFGEAISNGLDGAISGLTNFVTFVSDNKERIVSDIVAFKDSFVSFGLGVKEYFQPALDALSPLFGIISKEMGPLGELFSDIFESMATDVLPVFIDIINQITQEVLPAMITSFVKIASVALPVIVKGFQFVWGELEPIIQSIMQLVGGLFPWFKNTFLFINDIITKFSVNLYSIFSGIIDFIGGAFSADWGLVWQGIVQIFNGIMGSLSTVLLAPLNAVIALLNSTIDNVNRINIKIPDFVPGIGGKNFNANIPKIPFLADGGIVDKPTLAMIGEGRENEVVAPLSKFNQMINDRASNKSGGSKFEFNFHISVEGATGSNSEQIAQSLKQPIRREVEKVFRSLIGEMGLS